VVLAWGRYPDVLNMPHKRDFVRDSLAPLLNSTNKVVIMINHPQIMDLIMSVAVESGLTEGRMWLSSDVGTVGTFVAVAEAAILTVPSPGTSATVQSILHEIQTSYSSNDVGVVFAMDCVAVFANAVDRVVKRDRSADPYHYVRSGAELMAMARAHSADIPLALSPFGT